MSLKVKAVQLKNKIPERQRLQELNVFEEKFRSLGFKHIAGIDEAGRGPLAGPVVAAACMIEEGIFFEGVDDSKKLTPLKRQSLFRQITTHPKVIFSFGIIEESIIDQINIYQATIEAMKKAINGLAKKPDYLLVDGMHLSHQDIPCEKIIGGDARSQSIAAASIIAKQIRDAIMVEYHQVYPEYGFDKHKGYATVEHKKALMKFGPCQIHRRFFEPVRNCFHEANKNLLPESSLYE